MNRTSGAARRRGTLLVAALLALLLATPTAARAAGPARVVVPSPAYRTIQQAIDAVSDGGIVLIKPGVYREALVVNKVIDLVGAGVRGSGRTELALLRPTEAVPFDRVTTGGVTYLPGGGGTLSALALSGGDAGILGVAMAGRGPAALCVRDVVIEGAGRGIMGSFPDLAVHSTAIAYSLWNGISFLAGDLTVENTLIETSQGAGLFAWDPTGAAHVKVLNSLVRYNTGPGIAVFNAHFVKIVDSVLRANGEAGVKLVDVDGAIIDSSTVAWTHPTPAGAFGGGVSVYSSGDVTLVDANVQYNEYGLINFGSPLFVAGTLFYLNDLTLDGETFQGSAATFDDVGGNTCYERDPNNGQVQKVYCQVKILDLAPPDALTDPQP